MKEILQALKNLRTNRPPSKPKRNAHNRTIDLISYSIKDEYKQRIINLLGL